MAWTSYEPSCAGVFGNDIVDTNIPVDVWRYYLLSNRPETDDTDFKWSDLQARNNGELLANLGNFVNRVLQFTASKSKCGLQHHVRAIWWASVDPGAVC